ncbi:MAG: type IV secretion system DNA-binding domain-containing protein [Candidatus Harrisonbacteria bacterium]|nr:type IV secretion system DNA-binding domain-containing protein [Candidatus Harrisonbacteria bacterium]
MSESSETESPRSKDVVYFGKTDFRNAERLFGIKRNDRRQHMYVMGKTGTGKSVLLHNLILQDILNGDGVCVVDPHGELVEGVLEKIPQSRLKDVIYFNPADTEFPMGFNPLELPDPKYKHLVASGLMGIFTKIWSNVWSARMEYILNNAILALLDTPNTTLLGISRLLVDKDYRQQIISNLKDPVVKAFWMNEYEEWQDKFRNEAIAPIQNKVGQFLSTAIVRNVVGQSKSTIDIFKLMNEQKIFLVNVSKGRIGEDNSALMGAMIITKIQLAAMERVRIPEEDRRDFYLFVDEFQNFATDSFAGVLSEARKYRLNLIIAHQYVGQLVTDVSTKVRDAVFGNVGTMIIFRVGAADAEFLENEFEPEFVIQDIVNLPNYRIYLKLMVDGITVRPFSAMTLPPFKTTTDAVKVGDVIAMSRDRYARPAVEVEDNIKRWASGSGAVDEITGEALSTPVKHVTASGETVEMYPAKCSNCGKDTRVPFKPTPGKPVYCSECFEKIQKGELAAPDRPASRETGRRVQETMEGLAGLGIEYKQERRAPAPAPHGEWRGGAPHHGEHRPPQQHSARHDDRRHDGGLARHSPAPRGEGGARPAKPMPHRDAKPVERKRDEIEPGSNADIPALKSAIQEALKKR